ncbi:MAG: MEKHLA domain-containing protein [Synechococcus sp. BS307-5m-G36]|nr:MEKHLA domain-containing protein [Synechococcus sp. BS307-5m-G36]
MQWNPPWLKADQQALVAQLLHSHQWAFQRPLIASARQQPLRLSCQELFACGFPVLAHDGGPEPKLTYANAAALGLWDAPWDELVGLPSRLTAPTAEQAERSLALNKAKSDDAIEGYSGIRISRKGRRFMIQNARIWTLWDEQQHACGQAASFSNWWWM